MNAIQNMPLFYKISATELARELSDDWRRELSALAAKLQGWLGRERCVMVFTTDDTFHQKYNQLWVAQSFFMAGHEVLVLEPEAVTVELLHAAYLFAEPQYYLKTSASVEEVCQLLEKCLRPDGELHYRNGEFDELALQRTFGDYIMVFDMWEEHRLAGEADVTALEEERAARRAAKSGRRWYHRLFKALRKCWRPLLLICALLWLGYHYGLPDALKYFAGEKFAEKVSPTVALWLSSTMWKGSR